MKKDSIDKEYPVIKKMYQLTLDYTNRVKHFPRDTRFILGDRILTNCYDLFEGLMKARYASSKKELLRVQNLRLEILRFQTRLCMDMKIITAKQYGYIAEMIDEIGKMIGGWLKRLSCS